MRHPDGRLGLGSGWLTEHAALGGEILLRLRQNRTFHAPADDRPMILIGNGSGMAGLRAHLKGRVASGRRRNWLLFGERSRAHDFFHREEIEAWRAEGFLPRLDLVFSRDQETRVDVQDLLLRMAGNEVRAWAADGAALYVCSSLRGMAGGVDAALAEILGREELDRLAEEGRYRRDVY
jgi:sulfite reductase (NADPH) flavoprotein alpha-component